MKKFVVTLSALLCALCCAFCLTACDDDDKDESQNIMSAESWVASIDVATLSDNYALEISGAQNISVKVAGGKYYAKRGGGHLE